MSTILITGANGNLGTAVVKRLLKEDYKIISVMGGKRAGGMPDDPKMQSVVLDLMNEGKSMELVQSLTNEYKDLDTAILLVGGFSMGTFENTGLESIEKMIRLNFNTAYNIVRPILPHFKNRKEGGRFILIGARPPMKPADGKNMIAYTLSKTLVFKLAELINAEGKGNNINATVVVPSVIDTKLNRESMPDADFSSWVPPENIADMIAFMLSDSGKMIRETVVKAYNRS